MEKVAIQDPVVVKDAERQLAPRGFIPYLVATAAIAALVVTCICGSLYIHELKMQLESSTDVSSYKTDTEKKTYETEFDDEPGKVKETITVDKENKNELILQRNATGSLLNVITADFNKGVMAVYSRGRETCYIVIGAQTFLPTWESVTEGHENPEKRSPQTINLAIVSDTEIEDKSILPDAILGFCQYKPLYWAKPVSMSDPSGARVKRGKITVKVEVWGVEVTITVRW